MKGWIMVEPDGLDSDPQLAGWIELAMSFVETLLGKYIPHSMLLWPGLPRLGNGQAIEMNYHHWQTIVWPDGLEFLSALSINSRRNLARKRNECPIKRSPDGNG
jgi:hypothetical protein